MATNNSEKTWAQWKAELAETFRKWWPSAWEYTLTTTWKRDAAGKRQAMRATSAPKDREVTLTFTWRHPRTREAHHVRVATDKRERAVDNLAALARVVETLRMVERHDHLSLTSIIVRQMAGIGAPVHETPPPPFGDAGRAQGSQRVPPSPLSSGPYATLHITNDAPLAVAEAAYRAALRDGAHPDVGGDHERAKALNAAIATIRLERMGVKARS